MTPQTTFTFLTWNLCLMQNSDDAPAGWRVDQTESKVREFILEHDPDFVFFQELPGLVPYVETHDLIPANTKSHSGNIATIVRKELMDELESKTIGGFAVVSRIKSAGLTFANVHLEAGKGGDYKRLESLNRIVNECESPSLVIAGDTNTRVEEEESLKTIGLLGKRPPKPTWNSNVNHFRSHGRKFSSYYTRYFHNDSAKISKVKVWDQPFEHDSSKFYLSDHFALSAQVSIVGDVSKSTETKE